MLQNVLLLMAGFSLFIQTCDYMEAEPLGNETSYNIESTENGMTVRLSSMLSSYDKDEGIKQITRNAQKVYLDSKILREDIDKITAKTFSILLFGSDSDISEEVYAKGVLKIRIDSLRSIADIHNSRINSELMVGDPNNPSKEYNADGNNYSAEILRDRLMEFRDSLISGSKLLDRGESYGKISKGIEGFQLENTSEYSSDPWSVRNFHDVPIVATNSHLTLIQSQVLLLASDFVNASYDTVVRIETEKALK